jgi:hypothetical protein
MFRRSIQFLALGAFAAVAAPGGAAANPCCACVQVVCEQFYIVNHGPVYTGPGIVVSPAYFEQDRWPTVYPYVGRTYLYQPYDGPYVGLYPHRRYHRHDVQRSLPVRAPTARAAANGDAAARPARQVSHRAASRLVAT